MQHICENIVFHNHWSSVESSKIGKIRDEESARSDHGWKTEEVKFFTHTRVE